jgi:hypothetical protein
VAGTSTSPCFLVLLSPPLHTTSCPQVLKQALPVVEGLASPPYFHRLPSPSPVRLPEILRRVYPCRRALFFCAAGATRNRAVEPSSKPGAAVRSSPHPLVPSRRPGFKHRRRASLPVRTPPHVRPAVPERRRSLLSAASRAPGERPSHHEHGQAASVAVLAQLRGPHVFLACLLQPARGPALLIWPSR